jgi:hypothetical protein
VRNSVRDVYGPRPGEGGPQGGRKGGRGFGDEVRKERERESTPPTVWLEVRNQMPAQPSASASSKTWKTER